MKYLPYLNPVMLVLLLFANAIKPAQTPDLDTIPHLDKGIHFLLYGFLATTIIRVPALKATQWSGLYAWLLTVGIALLDESLQSFSPERTADPLDLLSDGLGAGLALWLYLKCPRYHNTLEYAVIGNKSSPSTPAAPKS